MTNWIIPAFISIEVQVYESRIRVKGRVKKKVYFF